MGTVARACYMRKSILIWKNNNKIFLHSSKDISLKISKTRTIDTLPNFQDKFIIELVFKTKYLTF
jgi:hypothetical protein